MAELTIKTNNVPRPLLSGHELTRRERLELDYVADADNEDVWFNESDRFFRYKGQVYDTQQFVRIERRAALSNPFCHGVDDDSPLLAWDGIATDSCFSGVVIRYLRGEQRDNYGHDADGYVVVGLSLS